MRPILNGSSALQCFKHTVISVAILCEDFQINLSPKKVKDQCECQNLGAILCVAKVDLGFKLCLTLLELKPAPKSMILDYKSH